MMERELRDTDTAGSLSRLANMVHPQHILQDHTQLTGSLALYRPHTYDTLAAFIVTGPPHVRFEGLVPSSLSHS